MNAKVTGGWNFRWQEYFFKSHYSICKLQNSRIIQSFPAGQGPPISYTHGNYITYNKHKIYVTNES